MKRPTRSDLYSNAAIKRSPVQPSPIRPQPASITIVHPKVISSNNNTTNMGQKMEALEAMVKKVVDENAALKTEVEKLKLEQAQSNERIDELETIIKNRRHKVATAVLFKSSPELLAEHVEVRFLSHFVAFPLKEYINFDMEEKPLDEVAKLIAIKMFEHFIPEGSSLADFSTSSTPRYGYTTIPSNLFEQLADKLVQFALGHEDTTLKHAILLRINFGLNDKIQRMRKQARHSQVVIPDPNST